jgi:hypothetical protein
LERPGGNRRNRWRSRVGVAATGVIGVALALSVAACGGESSSNSNEAAGSYRLKVVTADFPAKQQLGQTSLMRIGVRNIGRRTVPALTVTISIAGKEGRTSSLPFGYRDPEPGLAQPDRPVWVLAARYPKLAGSSTPAGAETSSKKTFDFGPLKPGATTEAVWKLSAVRAGRYTVVYEAGAGLSDEVRARTAAGTEPGGTFRTRIVRIPPNTEVTDSGEVVEIPSGRKQGTR